MNRTRAALLNGRLTTERLVLEPLTGKHAPLLWASLQDPEIYRLISGTPPSTAAWLADRWDSSDGYVSPGGDEAWLAWAVRRTSDGVFVGKTDACVDGSDIATNVGYVFFPPFWGNGYAAEATQAMASHLEHHGILELHATVTRGNERSCRVLEKAGFLRMGFLPDNDVIRGVPYDDVLLVRRRRRA